MPPFLFPPVMCLMTGSTGLVAPPLLPSLPPNKQNKHSKLCVDFLFLFLFFITEWNVAAFCMRQRNLPKVSLLPLLVMAIWQRMWALLLCTLQVTTNSTKTTLNSALSFRCLQLVVVVSLLIFIYI